MNYPNIIFPINFFQKIYSLNVKDNFIKLDKNTNYLVNLVFPGSGFVVMEIGFGRGDFLIQYAKDNPNYNLIGVEKSESLVKEVSSKLSRLKIGNVRLIHSKAEFAIYFLIPDNFLDQVVINFPDPWPKKAHISRRLLNPQFFKSIYNKMKKNSKIFISTDVENYKDFIIESVKKVSNQGYCYRINNIILGFWQQNYQTKYLRKWLKQNKKIFSIEVIKC